MSIKNNEFSREQKLAGDFNSFWGEVLGAKNLYSRLTIKDFLRLKNALNNINNIITLKTTLRFPEMISGPLSIDPEEMRKEINKQNANENGFDVCFESGETKILAEVKTNLPSKKGVFNGHQKDEIINDLRSLLKGKVKGKDKIDDTSDYFKFMVLLDNGNVKDAMKQLLGMKSKKQKVLEVKKVIKDNRIVDYSPNVPLTTEKIYLVYIPVDDAKR